MHCPTALPRPPEGVQRKQHSVYLTFFCPQGKRLFHERTGSPFKSLASPTAIVLLVVLWRLRSQLSLRDSAEICLARGFPFPHETVREWEAQCGPLIADQLPAQRHGQAGKSW